MKEIDSINEFKHVIKTRKSDSCSCRPCKSLFTKFVVSKKKKNIYGYENTYCLENQNIIIVFSRLPYVVYLLA